MHSLWNSFLVFAVTFSFSNAGAEEQRCRDLGANCVCSEPLNTNNLPKAGDSWQNPADSTVKECTMVSDLAGYVLERNQQDIFGSNDSAVLAALPAGHRLSYFARAPENHQGIFTIGHWRGVPAQFEPRFASRWYIYMSPNFEFQNMGACQNSKFSESNINSHVGIDANNMSMYNFLDWTPAQDCCMSGPGPQMVKPSTYFRGKWVRVEWIVTKGAGPGTVIKMYLKNITDNTPEVNIIDTSLPGTELIQSDTRTPPSRLATWMINAFRNSFIGSCLGWEGFSHYMVAGWDTDLGQRIGPAYEIEGGGMSTPPPVVDTTPPAVTVTAPVNGATVNI
jgi:hypothetical protein